VIELSARKENDAQIISRIQGRIKLSYQRIPLGFYFYYLKEVTNENNFGEGVEINLIYLLV